MNVTMTNETEMTERTTTSWRDRVYQSYVSSGQSSDSGQSTFQLSAFPYQNSRIRPLLPGNRDARILDLGCGHGSLIFCLKSWGYLNVSGVDVSQEQVCLAHSKGVPEVVCGDLHQFLNSQKEAADVILLMDVIEHLSRDELFGLLDAVRETLAPGGMVLMHMPNGLGIFGMSIRYGDITHENAFAPKAIRQCLSVCGYTDVVVREDRPVVHGAKSLMRRLVWEVFTLPFRMIYASESGHFPPALSQNMLVSAKKPLGAKPSSTNRFNLS
jgi:2-polyprenyl-3-methyl-5-hydroxy-6-metoxy-1,4-benzoquinol methylase